MKLDKWLHVYSNEKGTAFRTEWVENVRENIRAEKVISKHWINYITTRWFECSVCGQAVDLGDNFCKNCGADMQQVTGKLENNDNSTLSTR